jgi:phage antirepressor YoqD-like protein
MLGEKLDIELQEIVQDQKTMENVIGIKKVLSGTVDMLSLLEERTQKENELVVEAIEQLKRSNENQQFLQREIDKLREEKDQLDKELSEMSRLAYNNEADAIRYRALSVAKGSCTLTQAAKVLEIGPRILISKLKYHGIILEDGTPSSDMIKRDFFKFRLTPIVSRYGTIRPAGKIYVTPRGLEFLKDIIDMECFRVSEDNEDEE